MTREAFEGVNLGGWLILERWMTPSVFSGTTAEDEFSLSKTPHAKTLIAKHRDTFIIEADWAWLAKQGITYVRLPVGYWALNDDAPYFSAAKYLDWAFRMAEKYDIKILLDFHGLEGSQNAQMHSGKIGQVEWKKHRAGHIGVLRKLALTYKDSPALWGIEVINEPRVWGNYFALLRYYRRAYKMLCSILNPGTYVIFHDGFLPPLFSGALRAKKNHPVIMDTHFYLILPKLLRNIAPETYDKFRRRLFSPLIWLAQLSQPVIVGEWSSVLPQAFFDRVHSKDHMKLLAGTISRQRRMYKHALGTFYWNYKTEGRGMYNYRSLIEDKVIRR